MISPVPALIPGIHPSARPASGKAGKKRSDCRPEAT